MLVFELITPPGKLKILRKNSVFAFVNTERILSVPDVCAIPRKGDRCLSVMYFCPNCYVMPVCNMCGNKIRHTFSAPVLWPEARSSPMPNTDLVFAERSVSK